jgi:hypothetical protein
MSMKMKMKKLPLGVSDFKDIVTGDYYYVDKTLFIKDVLDKGDKILLVPRPRRFGKTLNLSMMKYFYDCCPQTGSPDAKEKDPGNTYKTLFANLAISRAGKEYLDKMGQYPVIFLSFRDIKELEWGTTYRKIQKLVRKEYSRHYYLLNSEKLLPYERDYFQMLMGLKGEREDYESSLENLLIFLNRYYGKRAVILIDEYDAPVHAGFKHGYYDEIINFLSSEEKELKPYWVHTADNEIVESLLSRGGKELKEELELLIRGETIEKAIEEHIVLKNIETDEDLLWSFLLMGGYLKQTAKRRDTASGKMFYTLSVPNLEVRTTYTQIINHYFSGKIENKTLETMLKALVDGEIDVFEEIFSAYVIRAMSFFDTGSEPEKVYHAFVMGLFLWLSADYEVKSNRESGYGRYDIMIIPREQTKLGFIIEFKKTRPKETLETAVKSALEQIEAKKYESELLQRGIENYKKLAIVFEGKEVTVKEG